MTKELISEALRWANGHPNRRSSELMRALTDALAAVPDAATEGDYHEGLEEGIKIGRAERDAALAAIEVTRKLHHKITRYGNEDYSIEAEHFEEDPESYPDLRAFDLCAECYEVERLICEECGGDAPIGHRSNWPCPTVAALDGAPEPETPELFPGTNAALDRLTVRKAAPAEAFCIEHGNFHAVELGDPTCEFEDGFGEPVEGESNNA